MKIRAFRFGILPLRIETGRFVNEALDNRLCRLCNSNAVEDEIHFLFSSEKPLKAMTVKVSFSSGTQIILITAGVPTDKMT